MMRQNFKVKKIEDLKKKFEEDKAIIAIMKAQIKFKPFWVFYNNYNHQNI